MTLNKLRMPPEFERNSDLPQFKKRGTLFFSENSLCRYANHITAYPQGGKPNAMRETRTCEYNTRHRHTFS